MAFTLPAYARSSSDISNDIKRREGELQNLEKQLSSVNSKLSNQEKALTQVKGRIPQLELTISKMEQDIEQAKLLINKLELEKEIKQLEYEEMESKQQELVRYNYVSWKTGMESPIEPIDESSFKNTTYHSIIFTSGKSSLLEVVNYLNSLQSKIDDSKEESGDLQEKQVELEVEKKKLEEEQKALFKQIDDLSKQQNGIKTRSGQVKLELDLAYEEQKQVLAYEAQLEQNNSGSQNNSGEVVTSPNPTNPGTPPVVAKTISFNGRGRDLKQGHGVGMSQFGALGAALQGWDYKKILKFYYPGVQITKIPQRNIKVDGYGEMTIDKYVGGAAEVPVTACEDMGLTFSSSNIWKCWPREAIKAQAVAFRTFGHYRTQNGQSICTTTTCQVYNGSRNMMWASTETSLEIITYNGAPITAVYSSDNFQGGGTANNDTVWSNNAGKGTVYPYLRSVNDAAFTFQTSWAKYTWGTARYDIKLINDMLNYANQDSGFSSSKSYINSVRDQVGEISNVQLEKDPSGRVVKVKFTGSKGQGVMAGWLFKSLWNAWVANKKPGGAVEYLYSLTFTATIG